MPVHENTASHEWYGPDRADLYVSRDAELPHVSRQRHRVRTDLDLAAD